MLIPANIRRWPNVDLLLTHRLRRSANAGPTSHVCWDDDAVAVVVAATVSYSRALVDDAVAAAVADTSDAISNAVLFAVSSAFSIILLLMLLLLPQRILHT